MALEELSFESVNGQTDGQTDGLLDNGQKVITVAHPEHSSGDLKSLHTQLFVLNDIFFIFSSQTPHSFLLNDIFFNFFFNDKFIFQFKQK